MKVTIIAAVSENDIIGKDNKLIWRLPADMKFFKEKTYDHCVIMGRKNYESIPEKFRPLPGRVNIIVSRNKDYIQEGTLTVHSIEAALAEAKLMNETEAFIIGGGEIYKQSMDLADELWITRVHDKFEGDTEFPKIDSTIWEEKVFQKFEKDEKHLHDFTVYNYTRKNEKIN
jgi:dihydrofolate reductase